MRLKSQKLIPTNTLSSHFDQIR